MPCILPISLGSIVRKDVYSENYALVCNGSSQAENKLHSKQLEQLMIYLITYIIMYTIATCTQSLQKVKNPLLLECLTGH